MASSPLTPDSASISTSGKAHANLDELNANHGHTETSVAVARKAEIVEAASSIIATEGIHRLSLARIEQRIGMSRGQLTYYFPTKEDILLAVFDRMLSQMLQEAVANSERIGPAPNDQTAVWHRYQDAMHRLVQTDQAPQHHQHLMPLVHTFMAQIRHREDYREKIAQTNHQWRSKITEDILVDHRITGQHPQIQPAVLASIIMALFQGLTGQLAVDPHAFDRSAMIQTLLQIMEPWLNPITSTNSVTHESG